MVHFRLHHPFKKFRPTEQKSDDPLWPPYRPPHVANIFHSKDGLKTDIKTEVNWFESSRDCFSHKRIQGDGVVKRGGVKRSADPYDFDDDTHGAMDGTMKIKEEKGDIKPPGSTKSSSDPLSPNKKVSSSFYTPEGLQVKESDLDDIFDSSLDDVSCLEITLFLPV